MIKITSQGSMHQYDEDGNAITTWDDKKCAWIVNPEYENEDIDWWGEDNDFPAGCTLAEYEEDHPNWKDIPDINVVWTFDEESYKKAFPDWRRYPVPEFPTSFSKSWGYIECSKEEAIEQLGKYCQFNVHAINVKVYYNAELIFDGKL